MATRIDARDGGFARPADLGEALALLAERPDAVVVAGSTDWGVEVNLRGRRAPTVLAVDRLPELRGFEVTDESVTLGAALTLSELERLLAGRLPLLDEVWPQFASRLIRNGATLGGNLATASPIGDTAPALLALEAGVVLVSERGEREVPLAEFFTGYRQTVREPDELIRAVRVPLPASPVVGFHKIAKRRWDDISSVAIGFALDVVDGVVVRARIGLGGVAATPVRALATERALEGRPWTEETVVAAAEVMRERGHPDRRHAGQCRLPDRDARHRTAPPVRGGDVMTRLGHRTAHGSGVSRLGAGAPRTSTSGSRRRRRSSLETRGLMQPLGLVDCCPGRRRRLRCEGRQGLSLETPALVQGAGHRGSEAEVSR